MRNQRIFELQKSIIQRWKILEKCYSMVIVSKFATELITTQNLKITSNIVYVNEKFLLNMTYCKSLERSQKFRFNGNVFGNVDWNYYHRKPSTNLKRGICQWTNFRNSGVLYIIETESKWRLWWHHFLIRWLKLLPSKTSNKVNVNEKFFDNFDTLNFVEKLLKNAIQW